MCDCPCCGCITVSTGTVKIVEKCGAFQKIAKPGLNCIVPCIGECPAGTVSMRLADGGDLRHEDEDNGRRIKVACSTTS